VVAAGAGVFELLPHVASPTTAITVIVTARINPFTRVLLDVVEKRRAAAATMMEVESDSLVARIETSQKLATPAISTTLQCPYGDRVNNGAARILVVDDEPTVREVVVGYLERDGYVVQSLDRGDLVDGAIATFQPDLIVLDIMLPGLSGLDVLRAIGPNRVPVIMLTALVEEADRVLGLELGADDYVTKPFSPRELVARVRSVLRRAQPTTDPDETIRFGELTIERRAREVTLGTQLVPLTAKEFDLLAFLAASPRQVFSRRQLLEGVWDSSPDFQDPATVTVHVRRLRNKIETDPENPRWITTVWGVGYRFES
jgi:DNA-binding response OmpR family regulator